MDLKYEVGLTMTRGLVGGMVGVPACLSCIKGSTVHRNLSSAMALYTSISLYQQSQQSDNGVDKGGTNSQEECMYLATPSVI